MRLSLDAACANGEGVVVITVFNDLKPQIPFVMCSWSDRQKRAARLSCTGADARTSASSACYEAPRWRSWPRLFRTHEQHGVPRCCTWIRKCFLLLQSWKLQFISACSLYHMILCAYIYVKFSWVHLLLETQQCILPLFNVQTGEMVLRAAAQWHTVETEWLQNNPGGVDLRFFFCFCV